MTESDLTPGSDGYVSWRTKGTNHSYVKRGPSTLPWRKEGVDLIREYSKPWSEKPRSLGETGDDDMEEGGETELGLEVEITSFCQFPFTFNT